MLDPATLKNFFPVVVTPSHDNKCFNTYVLSLLNLTQFFTERGLRLQVMLHDGESLITRARNNCVAKFLEMPEWTHLCWIDSDIGFSTDALLRLLLSDYDVAAGIYPLKREDWPEGGVAAGTTSAQFNANYMRYTVNQDASDDGVVHVDVQPDGFFKVHEAPTGFMAIKRSVFERMIAAYPDLRYTPDSPGVDDKGLHYRFFDVMIDPKSNRYLSEDYGFCRLWEAIGGEIHVDARSRLTHHGFKIYRGDFPASLRANLPVAVGGTKGAPIKLTGIEHLAE